LLDESSTSNKDKSSLNLDNSNLIELINLEEAFSNFNMRSYDLLSGVNYEDAKILKSVMDFRSKRSMLRSSSRIGKLSQVKSTGTHHEQEKSVIVGKSFTRNKPDANDSTVTATDLTQISAISVENSYI
jgi:hypothetical protein